MPHGQGEYQRMVSKPVTIRGVTYASHGEASRVLGVSHANIAAAKRKGTLDFVGLRTSHNRKPVTVDGVWYCSVARAAGGTGIGIKRLRRMLNSDDTRVEWADGN
jgi:hypothetical protein